MSLLSISSSLRTQHFPHPSHNDSHCVGVISSSGVCCQKNLSCTIYPGNCLLSSRCNGAPAAWRYNHVRTDAEARYQLVTGKTLKTSKIEFPHADKTLIIMTAYNGNICKKCAAPMFEYFFLMTAHNFYIQIFKPCWLAAAVTCSSASRYPSGKLYLLIHLLQRRGVPLTPIECMRAKPSGDNNLAMLTK